MVIIVVKKGGKGSGNFGHAGRPGKVGGSAPGKGKGKTREQVIYEIEHRAAYVVDVSPGFDRSYWDKFNREGPTLVYHGTREKYVESIKESGIAVGRTWMDRPPSVYFTVDEKEARHWASTQSNYGTDWSVIAFLIPDEWDNEIISDAVAMRDFNWDSAFRIERHISPGYILSIEFGTDYQDDDIQLPERMKERIGYAVIKCYFTREKSKRIRVIKGGPGSGNFGHAGRPGKVGGSAPGKGAKSAWAKRGVEAFAGKHLTAMRGATKVDEWSDTHEKAANTVLSEIEYIEAKYPEVSDALERAKSKNDYVMGYVAIEVDNDKPTSGDSRYGMGLVLRVRDDSDFSGDSVLLPRRKGRKLLNQHTYTSGQIRSTIRHEYGHILQEDPKWKSMKWNKMWKGLSPKTRSISRRARDHYKEGWAESFAMYTSREYKAGMLPIPIEDFLAQYLSRVEEKSKRIVITKKQQDHSDTAWIFLMADNPEIKSLWESYGSDEEVLPLHITLLYLGDIDNIQLNKEEIVNILESFAGGQAPIEGVYAGSAIFKDNGDGYPHVLLFDSPQLPSAFNRLATLLILHRPELTHGFTPHTTLAYLDHLGKLPKDVNIKHTFNEMVLKWGDKEQIFPFQGTVIEKSEKRIRVIKGGPGSGNFGHAGRPGKVGGSAPGEGLYVGDMKLYDNYEQARAEYMDWAKNEAPDHIRRHILGSAAAGDKLIPSFSIYVLPDNKYIIIGYEHGRMLAMNKKHPDFANVFNQDPTDKHAEFGAALSAGALQIKVFDKHTVHITTRNTPDTKFLRRVKKLIDSNLLPTGNINYVMYKSGQYLGHVEGTASELLQAKYITGGQLKEFIIEKQLPIDDAAKRIRVIKGGPGSGNFDHAGRPGKVGGSAPGKAMASRRDYEDFELRVKLKRYEDKGALGNQGSQAHTRLLELDDGTLAVHKVYRYPGDEAMGLNDAVAYELAQALDIEEVPMAVDLYKDESVQKFVDGSVTFHRYTRVLEREIKGEQLDEAMLFDILIGNTDRHTDNIMVHEESGRISLIDNSYSLGDSYMLKDVIGVKSDIAGSVGGIVSSYKRLAFDTAKSLTLSEWKSFENKARGDKVRNIIMDRYGEIAGNVVYDSMMLRMDVFKDKYEEHL